jgi:hypothetical protein
MTGKPIYDLRSGQCKFAISPDDAREHLFCAEPVEYEGCPYCAEHAARCFDRRTTEVKRAAAERAVVARAAKKAQQAAMPVAARPSVGPKF